jgi:heptosyltransferase-2
LRVIGGAAAVVCNSSMTMHAAAAFAKPCLTLLGAEFPSARAHARQWGHPETRVLGREPEHDRITTPEEVIDILCAEGLHRP